MARMLSERQVRRWSRELEQVRSRLSGRFTRPELRYRVGDYLRGLLSAVDRKNGWQLAEFVGELSPKNIQHFIGRAKWSAEEVRDDLQSYVVEHLGDDHAVLIIDETGFLKKGDKSAGVSRQYSGTAGRIENSQIGVFLAYRSPKGHALIDRQLYLPKCWTADRTRCRTAGIPDDIAFATKPELARQMLQRAFDANLPAGWVTADEVYGSDSKFRTLLAHKGVGYVVAISCQQRLFLHDSYDRVDNHVQTLPKREWKKLSCGPGTKGERFYQWAYVPFGIPTEKGYRKGLLVRRSLKDPEDRAYYFTHAPEGTPIQKLVRVAGCRWAVEECFEQAKQETGLDEYEVRSWHAWYRHMTLAMFAHAMLAALRQRTHATCRNKKGILNSSH
jgi:SRSO17 transposase